VITNADRSGARPDPDDERPDTSQLDWSKAEVGRYARKPGEKTEVFIDGAVGYQLRLIPSNKVLARFESTLEAWPVIIATIEGGRSPRTLALDALHIDGSAGLVSAGPRIEMWARHNNGEPNPYGDLWASPTRRVAEGAA
jgi:hypothetical protein